MSFICERTRQTLGAGSFPTRPPRLSESDGGQVIQAGGHLRERLPDPVNRAFPLR